MKMIECIMMIGFLLITTALFAQTHNKSVWQKMSDGLNESFVQSIGLLKAGDQSIFAGTKTGIYLSTNERRFYQIFSQTGDNAVVNDFEIEPGLILAATGSGLYKSSDRGLKFNRYYYSSDTDENRCWAVLRSTKGVFLGTNKGLFYQPVGQTNWSKILYPLDTVPIYQVLEDNQYLYFVSYNKIFRMKEGAGKPDEIFKTEQDIDRETEDTLDIVRQERAVKYVSALGDGRLIISTDHGFYYSPDYGHEWKRFDQGDVPFQETNSILPVALDCSGQDTACLGFVVATERGVFFYNQGQWVSLYQGMEATQVNDLAVDENRFLIAATNNGIFKLPLAEVLAKIQGGNILLPAMSYADFTGQYSYEPGIERVHRWAIEYAEVHPDKIKKWRKGAKNKAWMPSLDIGLDGGRGLTRSDSVFGSSSAGGTHYIGPDDKSATEDLDWDVSLSWDLADVIWNTDQTTIDGRSKLMVELRDDILNQVTRLYYERRRLQAELVDVRDDQRAVFDHNMRIEELTALIDGLTGGEFSAQIEENRKNQETREAIRKSRVNTGIQ